MKRKYCYNITFCLINHSLVMHFTLATFESECLINFVSFELKSRMRIRLMMTHVPVRMALVPMHFARTMDDIPRLHGQLLDRSYLQQLAVKSVRVFHRLSPSHPRARIRMLSRDKMHLVRPEQLAENDGPKLPW